MSRGHWTAVTLIWAAGLGVFVYGWLFLGLTAAPCLGMPNTAPQAACVAAWEAQRPWMDRLWETPSAYPVLLSVLVSVVLLATLLVYRQARQHRGMTPPTDIRRP
jgi:hypothetical protein